MRRSGQPRVLVAGAGIAGLALAGALDRAGAGVTVVEKTETFGHAGAGLSLFGNGFRALDALGIGDLVRKVAGSEPIPGSTCVRRSDVTLLSRFTEEASENLRILDRTDLHTALLAGVGDAAIHTGIEIVAADDSGVTLADGGRIDGYDLVIGADGSRSRVRASWADDPGVDYSGDSTWRGLTSEPVALRDAGVSVGRGKHFGAPLRDGRLYWFATITINEYARPGIEALHQNFDHWHSPIQDVLAATDESTISYLPIEFLRKPLTSYVNGMRVLVGDGAHAMTPELGQGANQALEDVAILARELAPCISAGDLTNMPAALRTYDHLRRPRSQYIASLARKMGKVTQADGAKALLRDLVMRAMPDTVLSARSIQLQDWEQ